MELLKELVKTPGVPGRETRIREIIKAHVEPLLDELRTDAMGNLIGIRRPRPTSKNRRSTKPPVKIMLAAHMDQIGFIVRHIDDKGYLRIQPVGSFDPRNLFARNVTVCTSSGDLPGVMTPSIKPIHISTAEERSKVPELSDFYIDMGLTSAQAKRKIKIGDMIVLDAPFIEMGNSIVSQCLDNRIGCWVLIRMLQKLKKHNCEIHAVWTIQEEVGLRGAGPATFGIDPDIAISCDTTLCCDTLGIPEDLRVTQFNAGVAIKIMDSSTIADIKLVEDLEKVALKKKIKCQRGILPRGGQDGAMMQRARAGVRTAVLACPVKYIHSVTETASKKDINSYRDLLTAYIEQL